MICILGRNGQLSEAMFSSVPIGTQVCFLSKEVADHAHPEQVVRKLNELKPKLVINAAAYTAVDRAESEQDLAMMINGTTVGKIAEYCGQNDIPLIHFSTDYVYSGEGATPHFENEAAKPINVYGKSKAMGEELISLACPKHLVFRTSWVYYHQLNNFVQTMLKLGASREKLSVVADQVGAPTYASDLASATWAIAQKVLKHVDGPIDFNDGFWGVYHMAGQGETNWYEFATEIFRQASDLGIYLQVKEVLPIMTDAYPTPAARPHNSRLNQDKLLRTFGIQLPPWKNSLHRCLEQIRENN
jgi:dTDP-4-dehydrorhamnose reductase